MPNITDQIRGVSCSTPCGISGLAGAFFCAHYRWILRVLNALRHQWFGRQQGMGAKDLKESGAQRLAASVVLAGAGRSVTHALYRVVLNALRHQWFGRAPGGGWLLHRPGCAQRLAASVVWAGLEAVEKGVENAVLNALRHQWFGRQSQLNKLAESGSCSTPCGISGLAGPKGR